jgi:hypothetical protein
VSSAGSESRAPMIWSDLRSARSAHSPAAATLASATSSANDRRRERHHGAITSARGALEPPVGSSRRSATAATARAGSAPRSTRSRNVRAAARPRRSPIGAGLERAVARIGVGTPRRRCASEVVGRARPAAFRCATAFRSGLVGSTTVTRCNGFTRAGPAGGVGVASDAALGGAGGATGVAATGAGAGAGVAAGAGAGAAGVGSAVGAGAGMGCVAAGADGGDSAGGLGAGGVAGAGGGLGALRDGSKASGSTYSSSPTRMPRWT